MAQIIKKTNKKGQVSYLIRVSEGYRADGAQIKRSITYTPEKGMTARQAEKEAQRQAILFEENFVSNLFRQLSFNSSIMKTPSVVCLFYESVSEKMTII